MVSRHKCYMLQMKFNNSVCLLPRDLHRQESAQSPARRSGPQPTERAGGREGAAHRAARACPVSRPQPSGGGSGAEGAAALLREVQRLRLGIPAGIAAGVSRGSGVPSGDTRALFFGVSAVVPRESHAATAANAPWREGPAAVHRFVASACDRQSSRPRTHSVKLAGRMLPVLTSAAGKTLLQ